MGVVLPNVFGTAVSPVPAGELDQNFNILAAAVNAPFPVQPAESASGIVPQNLTFPPGHAYRYATNTVPGTTDMTGALANTLLQAYQPGGSDPFWPGGILLVSSLTITASVRIKTDGYATQLNQTLVAGLANTPIITVQASQVFIDPLSFQGNIATDTLEFNHCISVTSGSNIDILGAFGTNIRGDVINIAGGTATPIYGVRIGHVDGTNIYRNKLSITGGEAVEVDSVGNSAASGSGCGYRDVDIEPNATSQQQIGVRIKAVRGAAVQIAGGNLAGGIGSVQIDSLDLDNTLLTNSTPGYIRAPSAAGNIGIITGNYQSLKIGTLKARNYQERLGICIPTVSQCSLMTIDNVDIANCDNTEVTFNTLFQIDSNTVLEIGGGVIVLAGIGRSICNSSGASQFRLKNLKVSGGVIAANGLNCEFENITYDATGVTGNIFAAVNKSQFRNVVITNDGSATLQILCSDNVWQECSSSPAALNTSGGTHVYLKCTFNGIAYRLNGLEGVTAFNAGTIGSGAFAQTTITVAGAAIGDYCTAVSFADTSPGYATVTWQGNVTAANTVTVTYHNISGSSVSLANNTLRALVQKAT